MLPNGFRFWLENRGKYITENNQVDHEKERSSKQIWFCQDRCQQYISGRRSEEGQKHYPKVPYHLSVSEDFKSKIHDSFSFSKFLSLSIIDILSYYKYQQSQSLNLKQ